jgi:hypothetical protein
LALCGERGVWHHSLMEPMTPEELLRLPPDERAALIFLAGMGDQFVSTLDLLAAQLPDCGTDRLRRVVRGLEARGLVKRQKLCHVGTEFRILAKLPDVATQGDRFVIPQVKQPFNQVPRKRPAVAAISLDALPLASRGAHVTTEPVLRFVRNGPCDLVWRIVDAEKQPAMGCHVRATLFFGRSAYGIGGVSVDGFDNLKLEGVGPGEYVARVRISASAGSNYTTVISAKRGKAKGWYGYWEIASAIIDP